MQYKNRKKRDRKQGDEKKKAGQSILCANPNLAILTLYQRVNPLACQSICKSNVLIGKQLIPHKRGSCGEHLTDEHPKEQRNLDSV